MGTSVSPCHERVLRRGELRARHVPPLHGFVRVKRTLGGGGGARAVRRRRHRRLAGTPRAVHARAVRPVVGRRGGKPQPGPMHTMNMICWSTHTLRCATAHDAPYNIHVVNDVASNGTHASVPACWVTWVDACRGEVVMEKADVACTGTL